MAKVVIQPSQTIKSPKALATQLLGGKGVADPAAATALAAKIREKNDLEKGQDLTAGMVLKVGKVTSDKFGTLQEDTRTPPKYEFLQPTPPVVFSGGGGSVASPPKPESEVSIKIATPDIILFDDQAIEPEIMTDLIFENIGGQEIISISRNDLVNGQDVIYSPIKNLSKINFEFNSRNILSTENTSEEYFENFPIKLEQKLPDFGTGPNGEIIYFDPITEDLIINLINIENDEQVEVEILSSGTILNDTIYGEQL
jgi:hypothetical protein